MASTISSISVGCNGSASIGISRPWMRSSGGRIGLRCKSDAPLSVIRRRSAFSCIADQARLFHTAPLAAVNYSTSAPGHPSDLATPATRIDALATGCAPSKKRGASSAAPRNVASGQPRCPANEDPCAGTWIGSIRGLAGCSLNCFALWESSVSGSPRRSVEPPPSGPAEPDSAPGRRQSHRHAPPRRSSSHRPP